MRSWSHGGNDNNVEIWTNLEVTQFVLDYTLVHVSLNKFIGSWPYRISRFGLQLTIYGWADYDSQPFTIVTTVEYWSQNVGTRCISVPIYGFVQQKS